MGWGESWKGATVFKLARTSGVLVSGPGWGVGGVVAVLVEGAGVFGGR